MTEETPAHYAEGIALDVLETTTDETKWLGTQRRTGRGFRVMEFEDYYGASCSLQQSSLADTDAVWLGINDADPKVMAADAIRYGYPNPGRDTTGWVPFAIPEHVSLTTRMHLSREQAAALVKHLTLWLETGEIAPEPTQ